MRDTKINQTEVGRSDDELALFAQGERGRLCSCRNYPEEEQTLMGLLSNGPQDKVWVDWVLLSTPFAQDLLTNCRHFHVDLL